MKKIIFSILIASSIVSCDIERNPYGSMDSDLVTQNPEGNLSALMNGTYGQLKAWSDPMHRLGEYAGDNMMIRGASTDDFYSFISYVRDSRNYRLQTFWDYGYKAIAQSSNIIKLVKEGQSAEIDNQLGECYYIRGMMYFYLGRAFGKPYSQNPETNLGVPIVNGTPDDVINDLNLPDRSSIKETYEQAINDLKKAESLMTINKGAIFASKEAAQAMLSRVYLYMSGTYKNPNSSYARLSVEYADKVINSGTYILLSRDQFMRYNTLRPEDNKETIFAIKRVSTEFTSDDFANTIGSMYANINGIGWGEMYASAKYLTLLDQNGRNDWRPDHLNMVDARAAFIGPTYEKDNKTGKYTEVFRFVKYEETEDKNGNVRKANNYVQAPITRNGSIITCKDGNEIYTLVAKDQKTESYSIKYKDGKTYNGYIDYFITLNSGYPQFFIYKCAKEGEDSQLHSPVISRLGEVYLNRAEANAKLGNYGAALTDLNLIRNRSVINGGYASLNASNASKLIDQERQLELAYQAERSYDVFRNGEELVRQYPGPHSQYDNIPATDYRVTYFIPQTAINSYPGVLTQNPLSN